MSQEARKPPEEGPSRRKLVPAPEAGDRLPSQNLSLLAGRSVAREILYFPRTSEVNRSFSFPDLVPCQPPLSITRSSQDVEDPSTPGVVAMVPNVALDVILVVLAVVIAVVMTPVNEFNNKISL